MKVEKNSWINKLLHCLKTRILSRILEDPNLFPILSSSEDRRFLRNYLITETNFVSSLVHKWSRPRGNDQPGTHQEPFVAKYCNPDLDLSLSGIFFFSANLSLVGWRTKSNVTRIRKEKTRNSLFKQKFVSWGESQSIRKKGKWGADQIGFRGGVHLPTPLFALLCGHAVKGRTLISK